MKIQKIVALFLMAWVMFTTAQAEFAFGTGHSEDKNLLKAGKEAALMAKKSLKGNKAKVVIVSVITNDRNVDLSGVFEVFDKEIVYGSSNAGVITTDKVIESGIAILAFGGDVNVKMASAKLDRKGDGCGRELGKQLKADYDKSKQQLVIMAGDSHHPKNNHITKGMLEVLGQDMPIVGAASDGPKLVIAKGEVMFKAAIAVSLEGDFNVGYGMTGGGKGAEELVALAEESIKSALSENQPELTLMFDCAGRRRLLKKFNMIGQEFAAIKKNVGDSTIFGFYGQGEVGKKNKDSVSYGTGYHISTVTISAKKKVAKAGKGVLKSGVGFASDVDPALAGKMAVESALKNLGTDKADVVVVYANYISSGDKAESFTARIKKAFDGAKAAAGDNLVIGTCATSGIISSEGTGFNGSVGAVALKGYRGVKVDVAKVENVLPNVQAAGADLAKALKATDNVAMLLLTDSNISHNQAQVGQFLSSLTSNLQSGVAVAGGNSTGLSDWVAPVYYNGELKEKTAIGVMFSGDIKAGTSYANNFSFLHRKPLKVTKSEGRKVYELNGVSIEKVVQKITGATVKEQEHISAALKNIFSYKIEDRPFIRFQRVLKKDDKGYFYDGWPNHMPEGTEVYLSQYKQEKLIPSAKESVVRAIKSAKIRRPQVLFNFNCNGRSGIGKETVAETKAIRAVVGQKTPVAGYYACGEFGTTDYLKPEQQARYLQFSSIVMVLGQ